MSLLDILCGAMGAFCFMMIALLPYWSPSGPASAETLKNQKELEQQAEELRKRLEQAGPAGQAALEMLKKLQAQVQKLQGQLNGALAEIERLKKELSGTQAERDRLKMRNPVVVTLTWDGRGHDMDLHVVASNVKSTQGRAPDPVDPNKKQGAFFAGEAVTEVLSGPGTEIFVLRDTAAGGRYEIYYKFFAAVSNPEPAKVRGMYIHNGATKWLPPATIAQPKTALHAGTLVVQKDYSIVFEPSAETKETWERMLDEQRKRDEKKGNEPPK
jgi:hypothetical protein